MQKETNVNLKLFQLQQEIGTISKDAKNPFYNSKYFDINSLLKQLQPYLEKYKLLLHQPTNIDFETGIEFVETFFECVETSQRSVVSRLKLIDTDPQKKGMQITYFRRYTLASLLALQAVDDDGNSSVDKPQLKKNKVNLNDDQLKKAVDFIKTGGDVENVKNKVNKETWNKLEKLIN